MDASPQRLVAARRPLNPLVTGVRALLVVLCVAVLVPHTASAAVDPSGWPQNEEYCGGANMERGSGQMDKHGWLYLACTLSGGADERGAINIYDAGGVLQRIVPLNGFPAVDGARNAASDVAPSPDGAYLYMYRYDTRTANRLVRQADGSYAYDASWALAPIPGMGVPRGMFLQTDEAGDLYVSSGLWADGAPNTIAKYHADGSYVTNFGTVADSWALGVAWHAFGGLAVTADGRRVFVADLNNSRVQRFDRQVNGSYLAVQAFGNTSADVHRDGACNVVGRLAAPYDVALTPGGELDVVSVSCRYLNYTRADDGTAIQTGFADRIGVPSGTVEVQRFAQDGTALGMARGDAPNDSFTHGLAVDRTGAIHLPQGRIVLHRPAGLADTGHDVGGGGPMGGSAPMVSVGPPPGGVPGQPDGMAPVLESVITPLSVKGTTIALAITAHDNVGVTGVRVTEDGAAFAWRPYSTPLTHTLGGLGLHTLAVQVRDAYGNVSAVATVQVTVTSLVADPVQPARPTGGAATTNGSTHRDRVAPSIVKVHAPAQVTRGRSLTVSVQGRDNARGTLMVRFATERGTWGKWQSIRGSRTVLMTPGAGWKGMFVQVRDPAGNRSRTWFQSILVAPDGAAWKRGTQGADHISGSSRADHVDLTAYDSKMDTVRCGAGRDTVLLQPGDVAAADCEVVVRLRTPAA